MSDGISTPGVPRGLSIDAGLPPRRRLPRAVPWLCGVYGAALIASVVIARTVSLEVGAGGALITLTLAPIALLLAMRAHLSPTTDAKLDELRRLLRTINDQAALSDDARRVLNRDAEREVLRRAIDEDLARGDWDAAMVLVKELAERCGSRVEAEEFRKRIDRARAETVDRELGDQVAALDGLILQRRWDVAVADAARIARLFPDSPRAEALRARVEQAQQAYKTELERRFLMAAREDRASDALSLLKELDQYLTEQEGEPYRELARGVIGKARDNLGAEFKLAVQDRQWRRAAELGERIIDEFPNSRMAAEIRGVIDGLRERAAALA